MLWMLLQTDWDLHRGRTGRVVSIRLACLFFPPHPG